MLSKIARNLKSLSSLISLAGAHAKEHGLLSMLAQTLRFFSDQIYRDQQPNQLTAIRNIAQRGLSPATPSDRIFSLPTITIVADLGLQQCTKYRVAQKVELLTRLGARVFVADQIDYFRAKSFIQVSTRVVFYRARSSQVFSALVTEARRCGVPAYYDLDDPIFSPEIYAGNSNLRYLAGKERKRLLIDADNYRAAMRQVDTLIASTPYFARVMESELLKPAFVWRNLLDDDTQSISAKILSEANTVNHDGFNIFYGSGSRAHDADFEQISQVLCDFLAECSDAKLHLYGHLSDYQTKKFPESQVQVSPFSNYREYLKGLAGADVSVVPLELSKFNECKSAVRFLDASSVKVATIASTCGVYTEIPEDQAGLALCSDQEAWLSALRRMAAMSRTDRALLGEKARSWALTNMSTASESLKENTQVAPELLNSMGISTA